VILGRVTGTVVSTAKHPAYEGRKLLIVVPIDEKGGPAGDPFLALDTALAGPGDTVIVLAEGNGVRQVFGKQGVAFPVLETVVGIVDDVELER
jgi:ethanolamine utilization protein EutN